MRAALLAIVVLVAGCGGESAWELDRQAFEALARGDLASAEILAEKAAARGGPDFEARRDFLLGSAAWARSAKAEAEAMGPRGGAAIRAAIAQAEQARAWWRLAAARKDDWPEARRNAERATLRIAELESKKAEIDPESRPEPKPLPPPPPRKPDPARPEPPATVRVEPDLSRLSPEEVMRILDRLKDKEADKLRTRRARQTAQAGVERDW